MKTIKVLTLLLLTGAMSCLAGTISKTYYFDEPALISEGDYTKIQVKDGIPLGNPGDPEIPYVGVRLLLPQNEIVKNVSLTLRNEISLGNYNLYPKQQQVPLSKLEGVEFTEQNLEVYQSSTQFPAMQHTDYSTNYLAGYSIGFLAITAIKYIPSTGELSYYKEIVVTLETEYDEAAEDAGRFLFENPLIEKRLQSLVDNFEEINSYTITQIRDRDVYDYIIVTSSTYADDFQSFVDFHSHRGYRTKIELIGDIYDEYTGVDNQDKLRNYFIAQYSHGPIQFVLLGGDSAPNNPSENIIPHRGLFADPGYGMEDYDIPADMYYACLDRTSAAGPGPDWNNDNDNRWGEPDEADLLAEFYIGRICMNNITEITNVINKMTLYSETPVSDELKSALLVGEYLWPGTYGGQYMNELIGGCSNNGYTTVGIPLDWTINTLYEMHGYWSSNDLYEQLNLGPNLLCHLGHGSVTHCLNIDNNQLTTNNITNNGINHNFINGYTQACYSGSYDNRDSYGYYGSDCFAEKISTMETATSTFIANSRYGWGMQGSTDGASQVFNREWIDVFFDDEIYSIGGANQVSKEHAIPFIIYDQVIRWCCYELNVFGDPSLELWTEEPAISSPTYPQTIMAGTPEINVVAPANSRITVYDDSTIYGYGFTNLFGNGIVTFDNIPQEAGIIHISIVTHNYYKYVGDIVVTSSVVFIYPDTVYANILTDVNIQVFAPDSTSPEVGVNVWAEGLDYITDTLITDDDGIVVLSIDYPFGPILNIYGQNPGDDYYMFEETLTVIADELTNPDITVTTNFGLEDTFALNLPGTIEAFVDDDETTLWINVDNNGFFSTPENTYEVTPSIMIPVTTIISKSGYNLYQEVFPVLIVYGTVSGVVTDSESGIPVSNAEVRFYEQGGDPTEEPLFSDITDSYGFYEITDEYPVDSYDIYIDKWGFEPYIELGYFLAYGSNTHNIVINLGESGIISGRLYDDFFNISDGNLTYFRSDNGEEFASVQTETDGTYSVVLPNFTYEISVSSPGHVPYAGILTVSGDTEIDYHLGFAVLFSNFEDDNGDFISNPPTGGWEWGEPNAGGIQAYNGINVWATNLSGYYVDYADWYLDSPEFNVPNNGMFTFYHYYDFEVGSSSGTMYDGGNVKISTNGGSTFTPINPVGGYDGNIVALGELGFGDSIDDWEKVEFDISSYTGENVIIRCHFASDQGVCDYYGWYIDNVIVGDPTSSYPVPVVSTDEIHEPTKFSLNQNYPNPFSSSTVISFHLATDLHGSTLIKIYNIKGQLVKTFRIPNPESRTPNIVWDGKDENGKQLSSGIYFYKLITEDRFIVKKMLLLR